MEVYIYKTSIKNQNSAKKLKPLFEKYHTIHRWTVDTEYIDNVLRVEAFDYSAEKDLIEGIQKEGYHCEKLAY
ncbi:MAG: hypothetical protein JKY48_18395 [Flavobacteriales bacterium]|nr:hypothetical protein [Flavobacteriales bacterium]